MVTTGHYREEMSRLTAVPVALCLVIGHCCLMTALPNDDVLLWLANNSNGNVRSYTVKPQNTAVFIGNAATIYCTSNSSTALTWQFFPIGGGTYQVIVDACDLNPVYADRYAVVNVGTGRCDLLVKSATSSQAGTYACQAKFEDPLPAQLVVIESKPVGTVDPTNIVVGDDVTLTCDISYTSNLSPMLFSWWDSQESPVDSTNDITQPGRTVSSIVITAVEPVLPPYTCHAYFKTEVLAPPAADNTPEYSDEWTSEEIAVVGVLRKPVNTVAVQGNSVTLLCRRRTQNVAWVFVEHRSGEPVVIVEDCQPLSVISDTYQVDKSNDSCNLVIEQVSLNHAGTYVCQDGIESHPVASAQLIVMESSPICTTNVTGFQYYIAGMTAIFTCTLQYTGNFRPVMTWSDEFGVVIPSETVIDEDAREAVSSIVMPAYLPSLRPYTCATLFVSPSKSPPAYSDPADNGVNYEYSWTSAIIPVIDAEDCADIQLSGPGWTSGLYDILIPGNSQPVKAYCDMETVGGGWTVFLRRRDGSINFQLTYAAYAAGFGDLAGEFWLGNEKIAALTAAQATVLRVDMANWVESRWAEYTGFSVAAASDKYRLSVQTYSGDAGDSMAYHNGMKFTAQDQDNDMYTYNCAAQVSSGAWWFNNCVQVNLNGLYNSTVSQRGVNWNAWLGLTTSLRFAEMKMRPLTFNQFPLKK